MFVHFQIKQLYWISLPVWIISAISPKGLLVYSSDVSGLTVRSVRLTLSSSLHARIAAARTRTCVTYQTRLASRSNSVSQVYLYGTFQQQGISECLHRKKTWIKSHKNNILVNNWEAFKVFINSWAVSRCKLDSMATWKPNLRLKFIAVLSIFLIQDWPLISFFFSINLTSIPTAWSCHHLGFPLGWYVYKKTKNINNSNSPCKSIRCKGICYTAMHPPINLNNIQPQRQFKCPILQQNLHHNT